MVRNVLWSAVAVERDSGMTINAQAGRLRETKLSELALRFAFGGLCTVIAGLVAKRFGPAVGGLFLAFPAIFPSGACLIEGHEKRRKREAGMHGERRGQQLAGVDAAGAATGCIGLMAFACLVWTGLPGHSADAVIALATAAWAVVSLAVWWVRRRRAFRLLRRGRG
jgi:uncharacterized protein DUF3147